MSRERTAAVYSVLPRRSFDMGQIPNIATAHASINTGRMLSARRFAPDVVLIIVGRYPPTKPAIVPDPMPVANRMLNAETRLFSDVSFAATGEKHTGQQLSATPVKNPKATCACIERTSRRTTERM